MRFWDYSGFFSCIWDLETGKREVDFEGHEGDIVSISMSPNGKQFVTGKS